MLQSSLPNHYADFSTPAAIATRATNGFLNWIRSTLLAVAQKQARIFYFTDS